MATHEEASYILQLQETNQQLREKLRIAEEALKCVVIKADYSGDCEIEMWRVNEALAKIWSE